MFVRARAGWSTATVRLAAFVCTVSCALALTLSCALLASACGGSPLPPPEPPAPVRPPLPALALLLPASAELVVVAHPVVLMRDRAARTVIDSAVTAEVRDAFARRTGVEPHEVEEVVLAEYEGGVALLARGEWAARDVVLATEQRMNTIETRADAPLFRRSGFLGTERVELVALDEHVVLYARGVPEVVAQIVAYVRDGHLPEGIDPALSGPAAIQYTEHEGAPMALYVPHQLDLPPGYGTSTLLHGVGALAVAVTSEPASDTADAPALPPDAQPLTFTVDLAGELPPGANDNLRSLIQSVAQSPLGAALGMLEGFESLRVQVDDRSARLVMQVDARQLAMGLRLLFTLEIRELFEEPNSGPSQPRN